MELVEAIFGMLEVLASIYIELHEDRKNKNGRGLLKRPSEKYVTR